MLYDKPYGKSRMVLKEGRNFRLQRSHLSLQISSLTHTPPSYNTKGQHNSPHTRSPDRTQQHHRESHSISPDTRHLTTVHSNTIGRRRFTSAPMTANRSIPTKLNPNPNPDTHNQSHKPLRKTNQANSPTISHARIFKWS